MAASSYRSCQAGLYVFCAYFCLACLVLLPFVVLCILCLLFFITSPLVWSLQLPATLHLETQLSHVPCKASYIVWHKERGEQGDQRIVVSLRISAIVNAAGLASPSLCILYFVSHFVYCVHGIGTKFCTDTQTLAQAANRSRHAQIHQQSPAHHTPVASSFLCAARIDFKINKGATSGQNWRTQGASVLRTRIEIEIKNQKPKENHANHRFSHS